MIIDLHAHLDHPLFEDNIDPLITDAKKNNVKYIVTSGINPETNRKVLEIQKKYPDIIKIAMGIYPTDALQKEIEDGSYKMKPNIFDIDEEIKFIESQKRKISAIGECGMDKYWIKNKDEEQKEVFWKLINLAERIKKPIIVHSRKAEQLCIEILEASKLKNIVMHCFSGRKWLVKRCVDNGWNFTIPTNVVRSEQFQDMVGEVPITQMFCETDSPYLSPFKDRRNEPAFVVESYKKIAEIKGMNMEEVKNSVFMNWQRVFE